MRCLILKTPANDQQTRWSFLLTRAALLQLVQTSGLRLSACFARVNLLMMVPWWNPRLLHESVQGCEGIWLLAGRHGQSLIVFKIASIRIIWPNQLMWQMKNPQKFGLLTLTDAVLSDWKNFPLSFKFLLIKQRKMIHSHFEKWNQKKK